MIIYFDMKLRTFGMSMYVKELLFTCYAIMLYDKIPHKKPA